MILCIGEILVDIINSSTNCQATSKTLAGGAPFNVCCNLTKLGVKSAFVGAIGDDENGKFLTSFAKKLGVECCLITKSDTKTTQALVEIDANGERSFRFNRNNTADYQLKFLDIPQFLLDTADIIHIGSLMLTTIAGTELAKKIIIYAKKHNKLVSFDVNLRQDLIKEYSIFVTIAKACDIVKMSQEELFILTNETELTRALQAFDKQLIVISKGAEGSLVYWDNQIIIAPTIKVNVVDTTGAGDAFFAAFLSQLDIKLASKANIFLWLQFANICGAITTTKLGAIDAFPSLEEIQKAKTSVNIT